MAIALTLRNVYVSYHNTLVLRDISCSVEAGERVAIVGPNGAGKSTLFRTIVGLIPMQRGFIGFDHIGGNGILDNPRLTRRSSRRDAPKAEIGFLPQRSQVDWRFPVTVFDVVLMGRVGRIGWLRWPTAHDRHVAEHSLELVGMAEYANRHIGELSGGQQQRVFIARALTQEASLLLMDEPFSGIDLPSQEMILRILETLSERGITVLVSTHDLNLAVERFPRLMLLNQRLVAIGKASEVVTPETLVQTYGGQALWHGEDYMMVLGDIKCCDAAEELHTDGMD